jgi:hypothetical protein
MRSKRAHVGLHVALLADCQVAMQPNAPPMRKVHECIAACCSSYRVAAVASALSAAPLMAEYLPRPPGARARERADAVVDDHKIPCSHGHRVRGGAEYRLARQHVRQARRAVRYSVDVEAHAAGDARRSELLRSVPPCARDSCGLQQALMCCRWQEPSLEALGCS